MSTFKECTYNTIKNTGELINGRLLYSWLSGGNISQPVYFGLKDTDNNWNGNLVSKGTSSFYLTSDTNGCTAEVKDSTYTPTTADANTAREIWLNIPKSTASRTIKFSYNGTTVLTVIQNVRTTYNLYIVEPYIYNNISENDISSPVYYLSMDNEYNEEYIARSEANNINVQMSNFKEYLICILDADMNTIISSDNLLSGTFKLSNLINDYNLTHIQGDVFPDTSYKDYIASFARGMYDSEQDYYINNLYQTTEYNGSTIYIWNPANLIIHDNTFICVGEFSLTGSSSNYRLGKYTIEL